MTVLIFFISFSRALILSSPVISVSRWTWLSWGKTSPSPSPLAPRWTGCVPWRQKWGLCWRGWASTAPLSTTSTPITNGWASYTVARTCCGSRSEKSGGIWRCEGKIEGLRLKKRVSVALPALTLYAAFWLQVNAFFILAHLPIVGGKVMGGAS